MNYLFSKTIGVAATFAALAVTTAAVPAFAVTSPDFPMAGFATQNGGTTGGKGKSEVTVDLNDGLMLVLRDDGEIFDITDADARVSSLRSYLVSELMTAIPNRRNLTTTGFNRNIFKL